MSSFYINRQPFRFLRSMILAVYLMTVRAGLFTYAAFEFDMHVSQEGQ